MSNYYCIILGANEIAASSGSKEWLTSKLALKDWRAPNHSTNYGSLESSFLLVFLWYFASKSPFINAYLRLCFVDHWSFILYAALMLVSSSFIEALALIHRWCFNSHSFMPFFRRLLTFSLDQYIFLLVTSSFLIRLTWRVLIPLKISSFQRCDNIKVLIYNKPIVYFMSV